MLPVIAMFLSRYDREVAAAVLQPIAANLEQVDDSSRQPDRRVPWRWPRSTRDEPRG